MGVGPVYTEPSSCPARCGGGRDARSSRSSSSEARGAACTSGDTGAGGGVPQRSGGTQEEGRLDISTMKCAIIPDSGIMVAMHACMWIFHGGLEATSRFSHCGSAEWISALQVKRTSDFWVFVKLVVRVVRTKSPR